MGGSTNSAFERIVRFIIEKHSEVYFNTVKRVSQIKNVHDAKNNFKQHTCFAVESCGA